ncbi:hypothetical protein [Planococcus sp. YIM B11945]|uniref:hypothetical protein n=1 Tax=Planococcus sp. YIM B11945 TaxID=3435410 RepID=UPI003D7C605B
MKSLRQALYAPVFLCGKFHSLDETGVRNEAFSMFGWRLEQEFVKINRVERNNVASLKEDFQIESKMANQHVRFDAVSEFDESCIRS